MKDFKNIYLKRNSEALVALRMQWPRSVGEAVNVSIGEPWVEEGAGKRACEYPDGRVLREGSWRDLATALEHVSAKSGRGT